MPDLTYSWHAPQWDYLNKLITTDALPHALLISGEVGIGKLDFAQQFCATLVCENRNEHNYNCGECKSCTLFRAGTYPDFTVIEPAETGSAITVNEIRLLIERISLTRHFNAYKIVLIKAADAMNSNASNALLKTLEEPPEHTIIILVSDQPQKLSATIRSRCQHVLMHNPSKEEALAWLATKHEDRDWERWLMLARGAPIQALRLRDTDLLDQRIAVVKGFLNLAEPAGDPLHSENIDDIAVPQIIEWLQAVILDIVRLKSSEEPIILENTDFYRPLLAIAPRLEVRLLMEFWDWLMERKQIFDISLNRKMFVEELFLHSHQLLKKMH